ncbi:MAG: YdeI family protein [Vicinamibacterales bacterium]
MAAVLQEAHRKQTFAHAAALDEALCWGWIDGQARPFDDDSWLQRYTPRRVRSAWSKRNRDLVARLEAEGRMQPSGRAQIEAAQADGRWARAYDSPANAEVPADFLRELRRHKGALAFFRSLNRANVFAVVYRLQTAKRPETRQRRLAQLVQMMKDGRKPH